MVAMRVGVPSISVLLFSLVTTIGILLSSSHALNPDGTLLLAFKYSIVTDPLSVLDSWHYSDETPCSWTGVTCNPADSTVTALSLPNRQLTGSLTPDLGFIPHLQHLDLSDNSFNGTLPDTLFNSTSLQSLSLANNQFSGDIPSVTTPTTTLTSLNLSGNALTGTLPPPQSLANLTVLSLRANSLTGSLPTFPSAEVLDLSSNQFNGTLPSNLTSGPSLRYLNLSSNHFSGEIPDGFGTSWSEKTPVVVDLSFNNFTGQIPPAKALLRQKPESFAGNPNLCGKPLEHSPCAIPSSLSDPPNATAASIPPAIAVIPKSIGNSSTPVDGDGDGDGDGNGTNDDAHSGRLKPMTIAGIIVADLAGIALLGLGLFYLYQLKKKKSAQNQTSTQMEKSSPYTTWPTPPPAAAAINTSKGLVVGFKEVPTHQMSLQFDASPSLASASRTCCCCIKGSRHDSMSSSDAASSSSCSSEARLSGDDSRPGSGVGRLVMVDGETEMDMETLLKASAYILGASGSSIVYKAVLQSGAAFAVRRLGGEKIKRDSFEGQVRGIAKLRHPNLVRIRGFYWGFDEKLIISDYVPNGSLASISDSASASAYRGGGGGKATPSSPMHLPFEIRLKIARGVARGLAYIHDKKFIHGNLKPSNILLTQEMDPVITDLGINWIINGNKGGGGNGSARQFSSRRSITGLLLDTSLQETPGTGTSPSNGPLSPYLAPEATKTLKPNTKWDVYSFGIVLLELLSGRVFLERELSQQQYGGNANNNNNGLAADDRYWALRLADPAIKADVHAREEAVTGIFKLGFQCANLAPHRRPSMKEALHVIERVPLAPSSSSR